MRTKTGEVTDRVPVRRNAVLGRLVSFSLLLASLLSGGAAPSQHDYVEGELLVKFRGGARGAAAAQAQRTFQHKVKRHFDPIGWQHIQLPPGQTVADALERYQRHPGVLAAEPNYMLRVASMCTGAGAIPDDPQFTNQWGLLKICATNAWATTTGSSNVVVAVIDSGIRYDHEDLAANMWRNPGENGLDTNGMDRATNGIDDDGNGYVDDVHGIDVVSRDGDPNDGWFSALPHGTMSTGPIGAVGNNGRGIAGVNWSVQLMALRFLSPSGNVTSDMFVETCCYVLDQNNLGVNVRVTSNSWGFSTNNPGEAVRDAIDSLGQAGILNVFAAGVERVDLDGPVKIFPQSWHLPSMINVAASDREDKFATNVSNWGITNVDLAAPGVNILTTYGTTRSDYIDIYSGTSFSCPYVAGAAALLAAAYPLANAGQIKTALMLSVDVVDDLTNRVASKGRLNVARAIEHPGLPTNAPPFIPLPPRSQTVGLGDSATFDVTATGPSSSPLAFQWQHNGADLTHATDATLLLANVCMNDSGDYQVLASNEFGRATSVVARLTVAICPVILSEPQSKRVVDGTDVSLSVMAVGAPGLRFQWQRGGADIANAASPTLVLPNVRTNDSGDYQVVVTNDCGSVTSAVAKVTVLGRPWIIAQPQSLTVTQGANVSLCVAVTNTATLPVGYHWFRNRIPSTNVAVLNEFTACTNLSNIQTNLAGTWFARFTNEATRLSAPVLSSNAYVTVVVPPTNQTVLAGTSVRFTTVAYGTVPISYQWQFTGTNLTDGPKYSGATNATLTISDVHLPDTGEYTVVVKNAAGKATDFPAHLHVLPTVRLVPCPLICVPPCPRWCLEICWPEVGCDVQWTGSLGEPWQPWTGSITHVPGLECALIPVTGDMKFFRVRCGQ